MVASCHCYSETTFSKMPYSFQNFYKHGYLKITIHTVAGLHALKVLDEPTRTFTSSVCGNSAVLTQDDDWP